jgi:seryl-tRNA synthetase
VIDIKMLEKKSDQGASYYDEYRQSLVNRGAKLEAARRGDETQSASS